MKRFCLVCGVVALLFAGHALAQHGPTGQLSINSVPWSEVIIDGRPVGNTPVLNRRLPVGIHTIELITADGRYETLTVLISANQTVRINRNLRNLPPKL